MGQRFRSPPFDRITASERASADRFLAELLGGPGDGRMAEQDESDEFLAELFGEEAPFALAGGGESDEDGGESGEDAVAWKWTPTFLQWSPGHRGPFPPRPAGAPGGRTFIASIDGKAAPADWQSREKAIFKQIVSGNVPDALAKGLVRINLSVTHQGRTITGSVDVMPDYLCVGNDDDYVYVPMDQITAQRVAFELGMNLPTARICHAVFEAAGRLGAKHQLGAIERDYWRKPAERQSAPKDRSQTSTAAYAEHSEAIRERMRTRGLRLGTLVAGHKKDVVVSRGLHSNSNRIAFHGFYDGQGLPFEPCREPGHTPPGCKELPAHAHSGERRFCDYAQGVRMVADLMIVDGEQISMRKVLVDPQRAWLISAEGPIDPPHIPLPPARVLERATWEARPDESLESESFESESFESESLGSESLESESLGSESLESEWIGEEPSEQTTPAVTTVVIPAAAGLGTAATTAPIATVSPQRQMVELLDTEIIFFAKARILAPWVDRRFSTSVSQILADAALMRQLDLTRDTQLMAQLRPWPRAAIPDRRSQLFPEDTFLASRLRAPQNAAELEPLLRFMHFYGLLLLPGVSASPPSISAVLANITRVEARMDRTRFDRTSAAIETFARTFKQKIEAGALADAVVQRELMPAEWAAGAAPEVRRLAKPVVDLLRRLRTKNTAWRVGLYPRHWWNEFSADIYLKSGFDDRGFYKVAAARTFFDDLDQACRDTAAPGQFAWKAVYNDDPLRAELDGKFGAGRALNAPKHGPGPDIHIHLDLRPLTVTFDAQTGFRVEQGRVVLQT
jgi:hypothetical protein